MEKGLSRDVLAAVPPEKTTSRPANWTLVDLAVVRQGVPLVERRLSCVSSRLDDLSMVVLDEDSTDPDRRKWLLFCQVHSNYLNSWVKQTGIAQKFVLEWYDMRLNDISMTMMQSRRRETLFLESGPSAY